MDIQTIKKHLMKYEDYLKLHIQPPYIYKIQKGNQWLYYFGAYHTYEPIDDQFKLLKETWDEFLQSTKDNPRIALSEGGVRDVMEDEETAITKYGEAGLLSYLSKRDGVEIQCPEVNRKEEIADLEKEFSKDEIQYYYFARMVAQWNRFESKPDFEEYLTKFLKIDEEELGWKDYDFSVNHMKAVHRELFNGNFDENNVDFFKTIVNPTKDNTVINKFSKAEGIAKDAYVVKNIIKHLEEGKSIFVVYGFTHAIVQEPVFKAFVS